MLSFTKSVLSSEYSRDVGQDVRKSLLSSNVRAMTRLRCGLWRISKTVLIWLAVQIALTYVALNLLTAACCMAKTAAAPASFSDALSNWQPGGAAALGAMADDAAIGALVTDSDFSDVVEAARTIWTRLTRTPDRLIYPGSWLACSVSGLDFWPARLIDELRRIGACPVLLIQGAEHFLAPVAHVERIAAFF